MATTPGKPDFSNVKGGHSSRTDDAAPVAGKPDFSNVSGGHSSTSAGTPAFGNVSGGFASDSAAPVSSHTVRAGESLSKISRKVYGSSKHWRRIFDANRDQIDNPDLIQIGQVLKIPPAPAVE
jgi:nucleoid-associated protein YgaU